jgi:REP element-mobilizing transposase RayT
MVVGYHLIWTAYGWWLPNDPRGSMSKEIRNFALVDLGDIHYGRKKIQPAASDLRKFFEQSQNILKDEVMKFNSAEVDAIADSFAEVVRQRPYTCYACAIMPEHVHLVIRKHRDLAEDMLPRLQQASRTAVLACGRRPAEHRVWGGPGWKVFLETREDFYRTIRYVEQNPVKIGLPQQAWSFVTKYDGWMPTQVFTAKPQANRRSSGGRPPA